MSNSPVTPCSSPDSSVHGNSQARILEWLAISFPRVSSQPSKGTHISCIAGGFFTTEQPGKPSKLRYQFPLMKTPMFSEREREICLCLFLLYIIKLFFYLAFHIISQHAWHSKFSVHRFFENNLTNRMIYKIAFSFCWRFSLVLIPLASS